jgi:hypothetical protein
MEVTCANGHAVDVTGPAVRFCRLCGAPLPRRCPNGHPVSDRAKFCGMCGASVVAPVAPPTGILTSGADRLTTAPTVVDAARRPTDATTYQAPTHHEPTQPGPSGPTGSLAGSARTPIPPPPAVYVRSPRPRWLLPTVLGGVAAVAVAIVLVLLLTRSGSGPAAAVRPSTGSAVRQSSHQTSTTVPPTTTATTTTTGVGMQQAQALSNLLTQSAAQRSGVVAAVAEIGTCGNLNAAQSTLQGAVDERQTLLGQLDELQLPTVPNASQFLQLLNSAWQSSESSDNSYTQWAQDEMDHPTGCVPGDHSDPNFEAAQTTDQQANTAKQSFVNLWNPVATQYGLPTWTPDQL